MDAFNYNNLFQKAKLYVHRALAEDREGDLFPFWISLSLELLARSTLAKISPALLAETSANDHILYAFGYETTSRPRSISTNEVFQRLLKINITFTQEDLKIANAIVEQRNIELHSAIKGFLDYPVDFWLADFYKICKKLLLSQGLQLNDLLGFSEANGAEIMIAEDDKNIKKTVLDKIAAYKKVYFDLTSDERADKTTNAQTEIRKNYFKAKIVKCPSCGTDALLSGDIISFSDAKLDSNGIRQERRYIPTKFACVACGLTFTSYQQIKATDLGGQFTIEEYLDPVDYLGIDPVDHIDIDQLVQEKIREMNGFGEYNDE